MSGTADTTTTSSNAPVADKVRSVKNAARKISSAKAKTILSDGSIRGHPLTKKQKGFFGLIAGRGD